MPIYDISVPLSAELPVYPGDPVIEIHDALVLAKGDPANVSLLNFGAHTGTHVDAPAHFIEGAKKVESLALDVLLGEAEVIEVPSEIRDATACRQATNACKSRLFWQCSLRQATPRSGRKSSLGHAECGARFCKRVRGILGFLVPSLIKSSQYGSCRSTITEITAQPQRQTDQLVLSGGHVSEIQSLENYHFVLEQRTMYFVVLRAKLLDR